MSTLSIAERVAAGVAWLDVNVSGWVERIDLGRLDLGGQCNCMLGQLYGDYDDGIDGADIVNPEALGFQADHYALWRITWSDGDDELMRAEYAELTGEWTRVIEERRAQTAGETP